MITVSTVHLATLSILVLLSNLYSLLIYLLTPKIGSWNFFNVENNP